jgi:hypothetical protein
MHWKRGAERGAASGKKVQKDEGKTEYRAQLLFIFMKE